MKLSRFAALVVFGVAFGIPFITFAGSVQLGSTCSVSSDCQSNYCDPEKNICDKNPNGNLCTSAAIQDCNAAGKNCDPTTGACVGSSAATQNLCGAAAEADCNATGKTCDPATGACVAPSGGIPGTNASGGNSTTGGIQKTSAVGANTPGSVNQQWTQYYRDLIVWAVNFILTPVLMAVAFIVFLYGVFDYFILGAANEEKRKDGRQFVLWGIIGFVIITSVWGLVNIVGQTIIPGSAGSTHPNYPTL